jgi:hypothetical protein
MPTFASKPKATPFTKSADSSFVGRSNVSREHTANSIPNLQRIIGNQAVQRLLQSNPEEHNSVLSGKISLHFGYDFSTSPVRSPSVVGIQTKLAINKPGDEYEQEADRVADQVMRMPESQVQSACLCGAVCQQCQTGSHPLKRLSLETKYVDSDASIPLGGGCP